MRRNRRLARFQLGAAMGLLSFATAVPAAAEAAAPILDPQGIRFQIDTADRTWLLTVSGPEGFFARERFTDVAPAISLVGREGAAPADGAYVWELRPLVRGAVGTRSEAASGAFHVRAGRTLVPAGGPAEDEDGAARGASGPAPLAPTHTGDVTIDGRLCVGDECTEFDTMPLEAIKMKQNNPWIRVEDTSAATFPTRDWQIKFNDSFSKATGGADYFGVEDRGDDGSSTVMPFRIDAGAPSNSLRVDAMGRVGVGTATPGADLQVAGDAIVDGELTAGSSRDIKHQFRPVDARQVLERLLRLPIAEWSYREGDPSARHMGPVAEEFAAAFELGRDPRYVSPVDLSGVAFAAIQGLHRLVAEQEAEIEALRRSRDDLAARLSELERRRER